MAMLLKSHSCKSIQRYQWRATRGGDVESSGNGPPNKVLRLLSKPASDPVSVNETRAHNNQSLVPETVEEVFTYIMPISPLFCGETLLQRNRSCLCGKAASRSKLHHLEIEEQRNSQSFGVTSLHSTKNSGFVNFASAEKLRQRSQSNPDVWSGESRAGSGRPRLHRA